MDLISLLVYLLVFAIVIGIVVWIIRLLPLPPPWGNVAVAIVGLICLVILLDFLLGFTGGPHLLLRRP